MENAVDALKMAFAVFVFVFAISLALNSFTKSKDAADAILWYTDKTNYYSYVESLNQEKGREVAKDAVIASLFRKQSDTYIIVNISSTEKYIFNYTGVVTEVIGGVSNKVDTNDIAHANYIIDFVNNKLKDSYVFYENIVEVTNKSPLGGEYVVGEDGTKLQVTQGDNKIILTYTVKV